VANERFEHENENVPDSTENPVRLASRNRSNARFYHNTAYRQTRIRDYAARMQMSQHRRVALIVLGLLCSTGFLWLAIRDVDGSLVVTSLKSARLGWAPLFVASLVAFCWAKAARWGLLLGVTTVSASGRLLAPVVIGYAGTTLMPMQLGELVRAYVAGRQLNLPIGAILGSIAVERLLDVLALVAILGLVIASGSQLDPRLAKTGALVAASGILLIGLVAHFAARPLVWRENVRRMLGHASIRLRTRVDAQLQQLHAGVAMLAKPSSYLAVVVMTSMQWLAMLCCAWISLKAVGLALPASAPLLVLATTILGMSLPAGPGYVGTIQLAYILALRPFDVEPSIAIAASLFYHTLLCVPLLIWGGASLAMLRMKPRELRQKD
jgi:uncharacterized protein (TIRG00374 family)